MKKSGKIETWKRMIEARKLRNRGLKLQQIADMLNCTHPTISYYLILYDYNYEHNEAFRQMSQRNEH